MELDEAIKQGLANIRLSGLKVLNEKQFIEDIHMNRRNKIIEISIIIESLLIKTLKMNTSEPDSEGDILLRKILGLRWDFHHINGGSVNDIYYRAKKLRGDRWFTINEGEFFEGTLNQYKKRFASNANQQFIVDWCKFNKYNLGRTWEGYL